MKTKNNFIIYLILFIGFASCTPQLNAGNNNSGTTIMPDEFISPTSTNTPEPQATNTPQPTITSTLTPTNVPVDIKYQGTALPASDTPITMDNVSQLQKVAQWGRGQISAVAFSPDGSQFVVSSDLGYAVYSMDDLQAPYVWVPFETRTTHETIIFSEDGKYLKLANTEGKTAAIIEYDSGKIASDHSGEIWVVNNPPMTRSGERANSVVSQDESLKFVAENPYDEESPYIANLTQSVFDNQTDEFLCDLAGEVVYYQAEAVSYTEGGCDIKLTAACGQPFIPRAYLPYQSAFSTDNQYLFVLYRVYESFYNPSFGILRIYNARTGGVKTILGNNGPSVTDYAPSPDGRSLLIAFRDDTFGIWDLASSKFIFTSNDFTNYIRYGSLTNDGKFLILQKSGNLEILSTFDGSVHAIHESYNFRLSPDNDNIMYVTSNNRTIKAMEIDSGKTVLTLPGHASTILEFEVSPDGNYLVSSSTDCTVKLWDAKNGNYLRSFDETVVDAYWGGPPSETDEFDNNSRILINDIQFLHNSEQVFGFGSWNIAVTWNINSGDTNYVLYANESSIWHDGTESGDFICPYSYFVDEQDNIVCYSQSTYDLSNGEYIGPYERDLTDTYDCASDGPIIGDGSICLTQGYSESSEKICVRDSETNQIISRVPIYDDETPRIWSLDLWITPDESQLLVLNNYHVIDVFEIVK